MNWISIISHLIAAGLTQQRIAAACGCSQAAISEIARGRVGEPRHGLGEKLLALHREHCPLEPA